jgi:diguanylate cyclase (GGDEF)-like protein
MAKRSEGKIKMTVTQQLAGLRLILGKAGSSRALPQIYQEVVQELQLPFDLVKINFNGDSYESLKNIESSALIPVDAVFEFPFPDANGALVVGHSGVNSPDKDLVAWLQDAAAMLGIVSRTKIVHNVDEKQDVRRELEELRGRLDKVLEDTSREIEATRSSARSEIEKVNAEAAAQIRDIQQMFESRLQEDAIWDELTLLPNAKLFPLMMSPMLAHARRSSDLTAVMYLEIGRLDEMTKTHGIQSSDRILKQVLDRMMKNLREGDIAVRGEENRILWCLGGLHNLEDTATVAEKMLLSLSRPLEVDGKTVHLSGSIGISLFPMDGPDPETLMNHAETALDVARKTTGNSIRFYSKEMNEKVRSYLMSRKELKEATSKQEFALHYQPVVRFLSNEVESVEALIRWKKAQGVTLYPINFLGLSEQIGISAQLDDWMIRTACFQRRQWEREGMGTFRVSVNLSQNFFWESGVEKISRILQETGTPADLLDLEIAEPYLLKNAEKAISRLAEYSALGVNLTIDDFGSGGGLLDLSRYSVNAIKLFPQYIRGIHPDSSEAAVVASALSLAHTRKIRVIAKAVETQGERAFLESLGCDGYQGNLFSPALPKNLLTEFLRKQQMKAAPVSMTVEKTQPMAAEPQEVPFVIQEAGRTTAIGGGPYVISCFHCDQKFDANQASWCSCITSDPTVVCPACQKCFCRATLVYRHGVWGSAPETFWDRKREQEAEHSSLMANPILSDMKRPLVLIVDDEQTVLSIASRLIRSLGYSVLVAQNGEIGLQLAREHKPDLVLSDALMPKLDGREMCTILKRDPDTAKIKAIIMTAFTGAAKYKTTVLREYQFDEHLQKPVEYERLRSVLRRFLG